MVHVQAGASIERTSTTNISRGLYVLRYLGSAADEPPSILVGASHGSEGAVTLVTAPDSPSTVLTEPGSALVIRADAQATIQMTARSRAPGGSLDANLRLEPLQELPPASTKTPNGAFQAPDHRPAAPPDRALKIIGHVARRGDVAVSAGEWIAGPSDPSPIEALAIDGSVPHGIVLEYQVIAQGTDWSAWAKPGQFLGSKGRALALTGVRVRVMGASAGSFVIKASALFLGSSTINEMGQHVELRSATGHDPLVGVKLELVTQEIRSTPAVRPSLELSGGERKSRVRVFRAGVEQRGI